jgi:hypothetical protein
MALIKSRPELVRNAMKAYIEGIHYYKTHRADSLAILAKYLKTSDAEVLTEIYDDIGLRLTAEKPFPTLRGIGIMLRELSATNPKAAAARPEDFVDLTFIKELTSSGFIDRLYKTTPLVAKRDDDRFVPGPAVKAKSLIAAQKPKANTAAVESSSSTPGEGLREHLVSAGNTLSHIALAYYGTSHKWKNIYLANITRMNNPHYLYIGQKIFIPS